MKTPRSRILAAVLILLAAALLAGVPTAYAWHYRQAYAQSVERAEAASGAAEEAIRELEQQLAGAEETIAELRAPAEPEEEPFAPDHPDYQDLYPDFYAPQEVDASQIAQGVIYLTFDDGPSPRTDEVLAALAEADVKATFFVVGQTDPANLQRLKNIADQGHAIGMHSYSHNYKKIYASVEAFLDDMYQVFVQIRDATGTAPTFFRFPGGSLNSYDYGVYQDITAEMLRRGFVPCDWNLSAQDATAKPLAVEQIVANVMAGANRTRGVVLMHDSAARTTTAQALPELIRRLREAGYAFDRLTPEVKPVLFGYRSVH